MGTNNHNKWAVLVGIDCYSKDHDERNLQGCVKDVHNISEFLQAHLEIPPGHITTLIAPIPGHHTTEDDPSKIPTKANIIAALENVTSCAKAGDFIHFHYSGHGDRVPTIYGQLKSDTLLDEVLCAMDGDIRDVELGKLLDAMVDKGLVLLVVLDCCHSGGATRGDRGTRIRCRSLKPATGIASEHSTGKGTGNNTRGSGLMRKANVVDSWFYRLRNYNVIAACQPTQLAGEHKGPDGDVHGALTYFLIDSLKSFSDLMSPITYSTLHGALEAKFRNNVTQQPLMLGEGNRRVFGTALHLSAPTASITRIDPKSLTLDKGSAAGVCVGDIYKIYRPSKPFLGTGFEQEDEVVEVVIRKVQGLQSEAVQHGDTRSHFRDIKIGWLAMLSQQASIIDIEVLPVPEHSGPSAQTGITLLEQTWQSCNTGSVRFDFHFNNEPCEATFQISISQDCCFEIRDSKGIIMPHIPSLRVDAPGITNRVFDILQHLHSYQMLARLTHPNTDFNPQYDFFITEAEEASDGSDTEAWASWEVRFKNRDQVPLYITILNLNSAWGVDQILPRGDLKSLMVEPNKDIQKLTIDMVPSRLCETDLEMRDVLKLFITTEQTSFRHYELPEMDEESDMKRKVTVRQRSTGYWFVAEIEIISRRPE